MVLLSGFFSSALSHLHIFYDLQTEISCATLHLALLSHLSQHLKRSLVRFLFRDSVLFSHQGQRANFSQTRQMTFCFPLTMSRSGIRSQEEGRSLRTSSEAPTDSAPLWVAPPVVRRLFLCCESHWLEQQNKTLASIAQNRNLATKKCSCWSEKVSYEVWE